MSESEMIEQHRRFQFTMKANGDINLEYIDDRGTQGFLLRQQHLLQLYKGSKKLVEALNLSNEDEEDE